MALSYWREYRSLAHIAATYQVSEPTVSRTIRRVEDTLMHSGNFALPSKKQIEQSDTVWQVVVVVDSTETPIERPKKSRSVSIGHTRVTAVARRNATASSLRS